MKPERFDSIVVGSGQAGKPLALELAGAGHDTAIVEEGRIGGTCVISGCTPSKTMLASARVAHLARRAPEYGVDVGSVSVDMRRVRDRKRGIVDAFSGSSRDSIIDEEALTLVAGAARFVGERTLEVDPAAAGEPRRLTANRIFLNVGGRPLIPEIEGLDEVDHLDSTSIMELDEVPPHLAILGGGPVGVEFGQMFRRFGSDVVIMEREPRLLPGEDEDVSEGVRKVLEDSGVAVVTRADDTRLERRNGEIRISSKHGPAPVEMSASHLLVAVGRTPNSDRLDLEKAGVRVDERGHIPVDEHCRTEADGVWAMGDVTGAPPFTHIAYDDFRVVASDVLHDRPAKARDRMLPYVVFTDPELGRVGLSERQAREKGKSFRVAKLPMQSVARAIETAEDDGFLKVLVEDGTGRILGAAMLAVHGGELMALLQVAMMGGVPYTRFREVPIAHPTFAESLQRLFATLDGS